MPTQSNFVDVQNGWDVIADRFNTHTTIGGIHPDAAVNIFVGWPFILDQIKYQTEFLDKKSCNILDFGCGAGGFCNALHFRGNKVIGADRSKFILEIAKKNSPPEIEYVLTDDGKEDDFFTSFKNTMDVVTAIHAFDWIGDIEKTIQGLLSVLRNNGLLLFSVFPKQHVIDSIKIKDLFEDFDSKTNPAKGMCNFDGIKIPVYVRDSDYYDALFKSLFCEKVVEYYPPYPASFLKQYLWTGSREPEMVILGYRKVSK